MAHLQAKASRLEMALGSGWRQSSLRHQRCNVEAWQLMALLCGRYRQAAKKMKAGINGRGVSVKSAAAACMKIAESEMAIGVEIGGVVAKWRSGWRKR